MADTYTELNVGTGGVSMDESLITYPIEPTERHRPRVVIASDSDPHGVVAVKNTKPAATDYGVVVRPIPFNTTTPGTPVAAYGQSTVVAANSETTVTSYICPTGKQFYAVGFTATGNVDGRYKMYINNQIVLVSRSSSPVPNVQMTLMGINFPIVEGQIVYVTVEHKYEGLEADYEGTILGYTVSAEPL